MRIADDGTLELGSDGSRALLASVSAVSFALRTPAEREALVAGFGRYLNSLSAPIQILLAAEPVDLRPDRRRTPRRRARVAACRCWRRPAEHHADYLAELRGQPAAAAPRSPTRPARTHTGQAAPTAAVPVSDRTAAESALQLRGDSAAVQRLAADAAAALAAAGVTLTVLDGPAAAARLARSLRPAGPPPPDGLALPDAVITGAGP